MPVPDTLTFPFTVKTAPRYLNLLILPFLFIIMGGGIYIYIDMPESQDADLVALGILIVCLVLIVSLIRSIYAVEIKVTKDSVIYQEKGPLRRKSWYEPLKNYKGVYRYSFTKSRGSDRPSSTYYCIQLGHDNPKREVRLHTSFKEAGLIGKHSEFVEFLGLPGVEKDEYGQFIPIDEDRLDKTIMDQVREGKLDVQDNIDDKIDTKRLKIKPVEGGFVVEKKYGKILGMILGPLLVCGGIALFITTFMIDKLGAGTLIPGAIMLIIGTIISSGIFIRNFLIVKPGQIRTESKLFGRLLYSEEVPFENIREIKGTGKNEDHFEIMGEENSIYFHTGADKHVNTFLKMALIKQMEKAVAKGDN